MRRTIYHPAARQLEGERRSALRYQRVFDKNQAGITVFIEELIKVNRAINANPKSVLEERKKLGLLKDLPAKMEDEILPFFEEAVQNGVFPNDGGIESAAKNDLEFYSSLRRAQRRESQGG